MLYHLRSFLVYVSVLTILPVCLLPIWLYKQFVILLVRLTKPDFGKTLNPVDMLLEEEGINKEGYIPKSSLVNSVTLEESLTLQELRELFQKNVLERRMTSSSSGQKESKCINNNDNRGKVRYPELRQYPVSFMGHTFWRTDANFKVEDHIVEECLNLEGEEPPSLALLHQDMINKSYVPHRSPWELVLINNYTDEKDDKNGRKCLILARFHHSMADARSILKLFVECLGEQPLKTAKPQPLRSRSSIEVVKEPVNFLSVISDVLMKTVEFWMHPWKGERAGRRRSEIVPQVVRMSPKLSLRDVKEIGKGSGGTAASVILAVISGAIGKVRPDLGRMFSAYILPKENHPETLGNHAGFGAVILPCDILSPQERLHKCHKIFRELKEANMGKYLEAPLSAVATLFNPLRSICARELMSASPIGITNIAGEGEGFSVGRRQCSEFVFSVGTLLGDAGVVFCISSYKDHFRIVVISAGGILREGDADQLASRMGEELESLKQCV